MKKAIITGQDGSYLAELLLQKWCEVHGIRRRASSLNTERLDHLYQDPHVDDARLILHYGDLTDSSNLTRILQEVQPDEVYNLGAQSHVAVSFESPEYTFDVDASGTLRLLEAIRLLGMEHKVKFYQASPSELYGLVQETPQKETTPFYSRSPYAVAKMYACRIVANYREAYGMYACNGSLFNHESPRREFLSVDDLAEASVFIMALVQDIYQRETHSRLSHVNVGAGVDLPINELARTIAKAIGYDGEIHWDTTKLDGTPRKLMDVSLLEWLGWRRKISLQDGLSRTYAWFLQNERSLRVAS